MDNKDDQQETEQLLQAEARMQVYGFLSEIFLKPPDETMLKTLNDSVIPAMKNDTETLTLPKTMHRGIENLVRYFSDIDTNADMTHPVTRLGTDYTFLLRGIRKNESPPPPYESLYGPEKTLYGQTTQDVKREYAEMGVEIGGEYSGEPPDHIGLELAFMRHLCELEKEGLQSEDSEHLNDIITAQQRFLREHLGKWTNSLRDEVAKKDDNGFYTAILDFTTGWIELEMSDESES